MPKIIQEKYEYRYKPAQEDNGTTWVSDKAARVKKEAQGREGNPGGDQASKTMNNALFLHSLPPGMDIEDEEYADIRKMRVVVGGTDDVTNNPKGQDFRNGYVPLKMRPTDDAFSNEHVDTFYSEADIDGSVGFCERGNTLDRI